MRQRTVYFNPKKDNPSPSTSPDIEVFDKKVNLEAERLEREGLDVVDIRHPWEWEGNDTIRAVIIYRKK